MNKTINHILKTNIQGQLAGADIGGGICIAGKPGIGKTQTMYGIAKELNMDIVQISIPEVSTEELSGIPDFLPAPYMDKYSVTGTIESLATKWSVPQIIEVVNKLASNPDKKGCILFIDDLHRVNMAVAPYLYGLLGERKLGSFILDSKVAIMGAMNDSDEAGFSGIDSPIKDRLGILPVPFDFDYWFANHGRNLHMYISSFLKLHPGYSQEEESTMIEQFGTPRSWAHLANELELYEQNFIIENTALLAKQKVSSGAANELAKHIAYINSIDFSSKIKSKQHIDIGSLKPMDQILYAYIINYVDTVADAKFVTELISNNMDVSNFVGFVAGELHNKFIQYDAGKPTTKGLLIVINKILPGVIDDSAITSQCSEKELLTLESISVNDSEKIFACMSEFIH